MPDSRPRRRAGTPRLAVAIGLAVLVMAACRSGPSADAGTSPSPTGTGAAPSAEATPFPRPQPTDPATVALARQKIQHVVFVIKENRTFDHLFGRFPGADGATTGRTCDGTTIPLARAEDSTPDAGHSFLDGFRAIDGGRMDCFEDVGYNQYLERDIPNYWAYARAFVLADRFFSSIYGPTGVEHLWTFAAQSDRFTDHERPGQFGTGQRDFCDDPSEPGKPYCSDHVKLAYVRVRDRRDDAA